MERIEEILEKSKVLFMKYGLRSITMDDIAKELNISKKTLYTYFKDKADLIRTITEAEIDRMVCSMDKMVDEKDNVIDKMIKINKHIISMQKQTPDNVKFDLEKYYPEIAFEQKNKIHSKMFEAIKSLHEEGKTQQLIREDFNSDVISSLQICRSNYLEFILSFLPKKDFENVFLEIFDYHIRGISTQKGLEYYLETYKNK